ncbi:DUF308 domain-containing protein [Streptomyces sp. ACA25]|nr:DUF308 domain-containing protein [Streptomyces sp. ACA25]MDB1089774.1 DUF308 domain-containing protein [Streptomyces sp. ACA25]
MGLLTALGAVLAAAGLFGLAYVAVATVTTVAVFGWLLLIGGCVGLLHAAQSRGASHVWLSLIVAALNLAAGVILIGHPDTTAAGLTLFAGLLFLSAGVFRLVGALVVRGPEMFLTLTQGAFGVLLAVLVLAQWPGSTLYVLGTFFSLALLFDGLGLIATGIGGRQLLGMAGEQRPADDEPRS